MLATRLQGTRVAHLFLPKGTAMAKTQDVVLTIDELAEYLKLSKSTLYHFARRGVVPGHKIGRHWRFHRQAIDAWMKAGGGTMGRK
jgi:excisionase family DNA binding protein